MGFWLFPFSKFIFDFKVENNLTWFVYWCAKENLVAINKDSILFMSRNYRSDSCFWKLDVPKISIFAFEDSLMGQSFVIGPSNFRGAIISWSFLECCTPLFKQKSRAHDLIGNSLSANHSSTETRYCLNGNFKLIISVFNQSECLISWNCFLTAL